MLILYFSSVSHMGKTLWEKYECLYVFCLSTHWQCAFKLFFRWNFEILLKLALQNKFYVCYAHPTFLKPSNIFNLLKLSMHAYSHKMKKKLSASFHGPIYFQLSFLLVLPTAKLLHWLQLIRVIQKVVWDMRYSTKKTNSFVSA